MSIHDVRVRPQATGCNSHDNEGYESPPRPSGNQDTEFSYTTSEGDSLYEDLDGNQVAARPYQHLV